MEAEAQQDLKSAKCTAIRNIWAKGLQVQKFIQPVEKVVTTQVVTHLVSGADRKGYLRRSHRICQAPRPVQAIPNTPAVKGR